MSDDQEDVYEEEPFDRDATLAKGSVNVKELRQVRDLFKNEARLGNREDFIDQADALWRTFQTTAESKMIVKSLSEPADLTEAMSCSLCSKIVDPPGYFCVDGHLICENDVANVPSCPYVSDGLMCNKAFVSARPLFFDYMCKNSLFECGNARRGCMELILGEEKKAHAAVCEFREAPPSWPIKKKEESHAEAEEVSPDFDKSKPEVEENDDTEDDTEAELSPDSLSDSSDEEFEEPPARVHPTGQEFSTFRFNPEDIQFIVNQIQEKVPEFMWLAQIPSIARERIPLTVAKREVSRLKCVMQQKVQEARAMGNGHI